VLVKLVAVSIMDTYKSTTTETRGLTTDSTLLFGSDTKPTVSQTDSCSTADTQCDRLPIENGEVDVWTVGVDSVDSATPRKRIKRSSSSSLQDHVEIRVADGVSAAAAHLLCTAEIFTPTTVVAPSLGLAQALPLSGRIVGTVWQPVQSQSATTTVSTSTGCQASRLLPVIDVVS